MAVFAIFRVAYADKVRAALQANYAGEFIQLQNDEWLVSAPVTAKELSDILGISDGDTGPAIVAKIGAYYGRASTEIWDFIKTKSESGE